VVPRGSHKYNHITTCKLTLKTNFIFKTKNDITKKKDVECMIEIMLLPLVVTAAPLNVGDEGVKGYRVVVVQCRSKGEVGPELKAIVAKKPLIYLIVKFEGIYVYLSEILNTFKFFYKM